MCDNLVSMRKSDLTNYVGSLSRSKLAELNHALKMALDLSYRAGAAARRGLSTVCCLPPAVSPTYYLPHFAP
jgi:hypothetical protein